jgi:Flp pilus assembly protein TadG
MRAATATGSESRQCRQPSERGAVTAELAMAVPLLVAVTAGLVWLLTVGFSQVRMVDAARETARAIARGDDPAAAVALGRQVAPPGARLTVSASEGLVTVRASGPAGAPVRALSWLPEVELMAEAVALTEDDG